MGCLYHLGKFFVIYLAVVVLVISFVLALFIDMNLSVIGEKPYFFDPEKVESYDKPMLDDVQKDLEENYLANTFDFQNLEDHIPYLPKRVGYKINFTSDSKISLSGNYATGYKLKTGVEYKKKENQQFINEMGWTVESIEDLKYKLAQVNCTSFEKRNGYRAGYVRKNSGTYYYRFSSEDSKEVQAELLDSCLLKYYRNDIFFEYKGEGRGPDCIKSQNDADFDERNYFEKWRDLIKEGKVLDKLEPGKKGAGSKRKK